MLRMKLKTILVFSLTLLIACSRPIYDFKTSYVTQLTNFNFKDQVTKIRQNTNQVSVVHFFKQSDGKSTSMVEDMNTWTNQWNGVFKIGAVDCEEYAKLCKDQGVTQFPTVTIYPPIPMPAQILKSSDDLSSAAIQKQAARYLHSNTIQITNSNIHTFLAENPSVPKVFLFTDKEKGVPILYKGLSVAFEKKLTFGIVRSSDSIVVGKYSIKTFPTIIVVKTGEKKHHTYQGKEFNFRDLFEFLNIYSEVFVPGGGSSLDSSATKKWMTETFPEIYSKSAKDICLGTEGTLCVILLTNGKPNSQMKEIFTDMNALFDRKIDRGAKFKFMWLNALVQQEWAQMFGYTGEDIVVVLNAGKRKRFTPHEGPILKQNIQATLDMISGGNARFNRISELPALTIRSQ